MNVALAPPQTIFMSQKHQRISFKATGRIGRRSRDNLLLALGDTKSTYEFLTRDCTKLFESSHNLECRHSKQVIEGGVGRWDHDFSSRLSLDKTRFSSLLLHPSCTRALDSDMICSLCANLWHAACCDRSSCRHMCPQPNGQRNIIQISQEIVFPNG